MTLEYTGIAEDGTIQFEFKYESILHVTAEYEISKNKIATGYGALILKEDETYSETIITKYNSN